MNQRSTPTGFNFKTGLFLAFVVALLTISFSYAAHKKSLQYLLKAQVQDQVNQNQETAITEPEGGSFDSEKIDAQELESVLDQIAQMKDESKRLIRQARRLPDAASTIEALKNILTQLEQFARDIKKPPEDMTQREAKDAFYSEDLWEEIGEHRAKIEFPQQLKNLVKELKRAGKLLKSKKYRTIGEDVIAVLNDQLAKNQSIIDEAQKQYQEGDYRDANDTLQLVHQEEYGSSPWDITCVIYAFGDVGRDLARVRDSEVKKSIESILGQIKDMVKAGDPRGACETINEIRPNISNIIEAASRKRTGLSRSLKLKLQELEELVGQKVEGTETEGPFFPMPMPVEQPQPSFSQ